MEKRSLTPCPISRIKDRIHSYGIALIREKIRFSFMEKGRMPSPFQVLDLETIHCITIKKRSL
jgi:hypothetical protein